VNAFWWPRIFIECDARIPNYWAIKRSDIVGLIPVSSFLSLLAEIIAAVHKQQLY